MAGMPAPASANALLAALSNTQQLITLLQLQGVLGRLMKNLGAVNSSPNVVTTAGGNLYRIAQDHYGDPTLWTGIAAANDLTDPFVQGTESLTIPPTPAPSGGVLSS
jgi:nucleoid-associated protein YgaU